MLRTKTIATFHDSRPRLQLHFIPNREEASSFRKIGKRDRWFVTFFILSRVIYPALIDL